MDKWLLGGRRLRLCDARGEIIRDVTVRVADPGPGLHLAAADPRTGRLAIRGTYLWILDSDGISVLGKMRLRESTPPRISFLGPDDVAAVDATGRAVVYGVTGGLRLQVVANLPAVCRDFVPLRGETAVLHSGIVRYLKPEVFDDVRHSRPLAGSAARHCGARPTAGPTRWAGGATATGSPTSSGAVTPPSRNSPSARWPGWARMT